MINDDVDSFGADLRISMSLEMQDFIHGLEESEGHCKLPSSLLLHALDMVYTNETCLLPVLMTGQRSTARMLSYLNNNGS
jgi:hypothetical protein